MVRCCIQLALMALLTLSCVTMPAQGPVEQVPAETTTTEETVAASRDQAFDAALAVAQELNLNVDVLGKASGLLKFENAFLSAPQLDRYCDYPWQYRATGEPFDTFTNWDSRSQTQGAGTVKGNVALNVLMKEVGPEETEVSIRTTLSAGNRNETAQCTSTEVLEEEFLNGLKEELGG